MTPYSCYLTAGCMTVLRLEFNENLPLCDAAVSMLGYQHFIEDFGAEKLRWQIGFKAMRQLRQSRAAQANRANPDNSFNPKLLMGFPINP